MKFVRLFYLSFLIICFMLIKTEQRHGNSASSSSRNSRSSSSSSSNSITSSRAIPKASSFLHRSFLKGYYRTVKGNHQHHHPEVFRIRQVPGDGGCLFHALAAWLTFLQSQQHVDFDWRMRNLSLKLRRLAVNILKRNETLILEDGEKIDTNSLLTMVAEHYDMTVAEYCEQMNNPRTWGGGPEIVALSNHFQCPIHVYQLTTTTKAFFQKSFGLEICAKFGSPDFDEKMPIYLLCADGRFPNIKPGEQKETGDHFLALFPATMLRGGKTKQYSRLSPRHFITNLLRKNNEEEDDNDENEYYEDEVKSSVDNIKKEPILCDMSLCPHLQQEAELLGGKIKRKPPFPWHIKPSATIQVEKRIASEERYDDNNIWTLSNLFKKWFHW